MGLHGGSLVGSTAWRRGWCSCWCGGTEAEECQREEDLHVEFESNSERKETKRSNARKERGQDFSRGFKERMESGRAECWTTMKKWKPATLKHWHDRSIAKLEEPPTGSRRSGTQHVDSGAAYDSGTHVW